MPQPSWLCVEMMMKGREQHLRETKHISHQCFSFRCQ
jgi:hypothetical protein